MTLPMILFFLILLLDSCAKTSWNKEKRNMSYQNQSKSQQEGAMNFVDTSL